MSRKGIYVLSHVDKQGNTCRDREIEYYGYSHVEGSRNEGLPNRSQGIRYVQVLHIGTERN